MKWKLVCILVRFAGTLGVEESMEITIVFRVWGLGGNGYRYSRRIWDSYRDLPLSPLSKQVKIVRISVSFLYGAIGEIYSWMYELAVYFPYGSYGNFIHE